MSLRPDPVGPVPDETARVARAAFPRGTAWMRQRDELEPIYRDAICASLFSQRGRPAEAPWRLALISVMQFAERLSDCRAADAVRGRIDSKYALDDTGACPEQAIVGLDRGGELRPARRHERRGPAASPLRSCSEVRYEPIA